MIITTSLAGCASMENVHPGYNGNQDQMIHKNENEKLWLDNKGWLLSKLPKTEPLERDIISALQESSDSKLSCSDQTEHGCEKFLKQLDQKIAPFKSVQLPEDTNSVALVNGDTAYVFRMSDWTFSGIANLTSGIYFTVVDVPLRRTDERGFAFVADKKTDSETVWTVYRRNILDKGKGSSALGVYTITRVELDSGGVPRQVDYLTPQQRSERELAKQGLIWRRRTQIKAISICSKSESGSGSRKSDGHGGRSKHNRATSADSTTAGSPTATATTMAEALQGNAHLNCKTGSGSVMTEDGIAAEVYRLIKDKEGIDAIIAATAKEIPGGVIRYKYPVGQDSNDFLNPDAGKDMILQFETIDGSNKLNLNLHADSGISIGTLSLAGKGIINSGYRIHDKEVSTNEFAAFFIRAYRDCAMKDSQGICKNIPDLFMSLQNPLILEEFIQYISAHYL
jgi:hypothetical protein